MKSDRLLRRSYEQKFEKIKKAQIETPQQGWIKTVRELFGMTSTQLAKKLKVSQPRIMAMEKNEQNLKLSTLAKIAEFLNCKLVWAFVPCKKIDDILREQAKCKALKILKKVNRNMGLENQLAKDDKILEDLVKDLLDNNIARIWDDEK